MGYRYSKSSYLHLVADHSALRIRSLVHSAELDPFVESETLMSAFTKTS